VAAAASGIPAGAELVTLVLSLVGATSAQEAMLSSIKEDTKLLRDEPFRTSRTMLAEAKRVGPTDPRFRDFMDACVSGLYRAHSLTSSASERALIEFDLAAVYLCVGPRADAAHWGAQSQASARAAVEDEIIGRELYSGAHFRSVVLDGRPKPAESEDPWTKLKTWWRSSGPVVPVVDPISAIAAGVLQLAEHKHARKEFEAGVAALQDLIAFVNAVEAVGAALSAVPARPALTLEVNALVATLKQISTSEARA